MKNLTGKRIKDLRTDNCTECTNADFNDFPKQCGTGKKRLVALSNN